MTWGLGRLKTAVALAIDRCHIVVEDPIAGKHK